MSQLDNLTDHDVEELLIEVDRLQAKTDQQRQRLDDLKKLVDLLVIEEVLAPNVGARLTEAIQTKLETRIEIQIPW